MLTVAIVIIGALSAFLGLAALGAMREIVLLRGELRGFDELIRRPPPPGYVGGRVPDALVSHLERTLVGRNASPRLVAFASPGCQPCENLVDALGSATQSGEIDSNLLVFVAWASNEEEARRFAVRLPGHTIIDDGSLVRSCEVRATPTMLLVEPSGWRATEVNLEGDSEWAIQRLTSREAVPAEH